MISHNTLNENIINHLFFSYSQLIFLPIHYLLRIPIPIPISDNIEKLKSLGFRLEEPF